MRPQSPDALRFADKARAPAASVTARELAILSGAFTLIALVMAIGFPLLQPENGRFIDRAIHLFPYYWIWALLSPAILLATRVLISRDVATRVQLSAHVLLAIVFAIVQVTFYVLLVDPIVPRWITQPLSERLMSAAQRHAASNLLTYAGVAAATALIDHFRRTREALAHARLETLRAQLQPHFLFNALQVASSLMHRDIAAAEEMLERLGDFLRMVLRRDERHLVTLREELELLDHYLAVMRLRFGDRLRFELDADIGLHRALVPVLLLQPLVENALQHGISPRPGEGLLRVSVSRSNDELIVAVEDNGTRGHDDGGVQERIGLSNTRAKLATLFGGKQRLTLAPSPHGGMRVEVRLPLLLDDLSRASTRTAVASTLPQPHGDRP